MFPQSGFGNRALTSSHLGTAVVDGNFNTLQVQGVDVATVDDLSTVQTQLQNTISGVNTVLATSVNGKMGLGGSQTLTNDIVAANDTYKFMGAKPSEIAHLSVVSSNIQNKLNDLVNKETYTMGSSWNWPENTLLTVRWGTEDPSVTISTPISAAQLAFLATLGLDDYNKYVTTLPIRNISLGNNQCLSTTDLLSINYGNVVTNLSAAELSSLDGITSNIQTQLNNKQASGDYMTRGGVQTLTSNVTAANDTYTFMGAKPSEISYLNGVSSNIQTQLDGKLNGGANIIVPGSLRLTGNSTPLLAPNSTYATLEFGYGIPGKESNAGKIGYGFISPNTSSFLDILGAGTTGTNRAVRIFDNLTVVREVSVGTLLTLGTNGISAGGTSYTAATLKAKLDKDTLTTGGVQTLVSNVTAANDTYSFMGAKPSEIARLSGVSTNIQTQLDAKLNSSKIADKTLNGNFATLKVNDTNVVTDISMKLDSSKISDKTLNANFASVSVNDVNVVSDMYTKINDKYDKTGGTISGTLNVTGVTTLSGGFNATSGAITIIKSNVGQGAMVSISYREMGLPSIGYYVWSIRNNRTWIDGEDFWAMGRVTINSGVGLVYHWADSSSNLTMSASPTVEGGFYFTNYAGSNQTYTFRMNRLI